MIAQDITALRLQLRKNGFDPIPVEGKEPHMNGWQTKLNVSNDEIRLWPKTYHLAHNTGALAKNTPGLDIDIMHEAAANAVEMLAREFFEEHGDIHVRFGRPPKRLIPLRTDEPFTKLFRVFSEPKGPDGKEPKIEILGDGQQYIVAGIHPDTGKPYGWFGGDLIDIKREKLPYVRREDMELFLDAAVKLLVEDFGFVLASAGAQTNGGDPHESGEDPQASPELVAAALEVIPNTADWDGWNAIGMATWRATGGSAEGFAAFDAWSKKSPKYMARTTAEKWAAFFKCPPNQIGVGTIFYLADEASPDWRDEYNARQGGPQPGSQQPGPQPGGPQPGGPQPGGPQPGGPQPGGPQPSSPPPPPPGASPQPGTPPPGAGPQRGSQPGTPPPQPTPATSGLGEWNAAEDVKAPPPRGWLLGNTFCRTFLSSLLGSGGVGKTALRYTQALGLATGRKLTDEHIFQRCRVLIVSLEDDAAELRRRIRAVRLYHNIPLSELDGWLFLAAPGAKAGKLMEMDKKGRVKEGTLRANLEAAIIAHKIDLVMLDPFVKSHSVEENLNSAIDDVAQILTDLATKHNIAVDAPHHVRKGQMEAGDAAAGRGASALIAAARLVYTCLPMTEDEAKIFDISPEDRRDYIRVDSAKVNIARASRNATWFHLVNVSLDNASTLYPAGDQVQTVESWSPPDAWKGTTSAELNAILNDIDLGLVDNNGKPTGQRYSNAPKAGKRTVWPVVQRYYPNKSEGECRTIIHAWLGTGLLYAQQYDDPLEYKKRSGLYVDNAKRPT
jgi:hypothetical protein